MMQTLHTIYVIIAELFIAELTFPFITVVIAQLFGKEKLVSRYFPEREFDFACIIPAYQNAAAARRLVESLLKQTHRRFTVYLVADDCLELDLGIYDERFVLLRPESPLRLKVKSILYATDHFLREHEYVVIFEANNFAHPGFLEEINKYANSSYPCIQGQRKIKTPDTAAAALDSLSEHYRNYTERYVPHLLGGSSVISGSGMATETAMYMAYLNSPEIEKGLATGGNMLQEDKILQNFLVRQNKRIAYARHAIVFDEKEKSAETADHQRSRWLSTYFQNLPNATRLIGLGLARASFNQVYFGFVTFAMPMFMLIGMGVVLVLLGISISPHGSEAVVAAIGIFIFNIFWCLKLDHAPVPVWKAVRGVPRFAWRQIAGFFKTNKPEENIRLSGLKKFVPTDEVLEK